MNNQIIELLNSFKFHCEAYINQFKQLCEICEIPEQSELLGREQLYEYGTKIKKINGWHSQKYKAMENPYDAGQGFYRNIAVFDQFYYFKVDEVSINLINSLNSYLLENSNHDAIKKLLRKDLDTYENFKDFECLNELGNFKTVIKLIIEQCDYKEKNNVPKPDIDRIKAIENSVEEYFFKTNKNLRKLYETDTSEKMEFFRDKSNFQSEINSCIDSESLQTHLNETLRKWKGEKSLWIEYTNLRILPPENSNNVLKSKLASAWFKWFESHKEQESKPIINDIEFEAKPIFKPEIIEIIFDLLKDFFSIEQQKDFKIFIETGNNVKEKLLFLDNGNRLADAFKQLKRADLITGCNQTDLINCIEKNFSYFYRNEVKSYKSKYLEKIISTPNDNCKKPILNVKGTSIQKA